MSNKVSVELNEKIFSIEAGKVARQSNGSVLVQYGDTVVLVTAVFMNETKEGADFFPLTVDYIEKSFAAGKIPGGFFKREGRPTEKEIVTSRLIDRPIRPLFPQGFNNETQIIATVLSVDQENDPDVIALTGASAALMISDIPFSGPIAGVRVGRINGNFVCNPTISELKISDIDLVIAGNRDAVIMVEGGARMVSEDEILNAIEFGHNALSPLLDIQEKLVIFQGKEKTKVKLKEKDEILEKSVKALIEHNLMDAISIPQKIERREAERKIYEESLGKLLLDYPDREEDIKYIFHETEKDIMRKFIKEKKQRIDGRRLSDIRPISCEVGVLPRTHGSALFTRGETQVLAVTTLGTSEDEQKIDALEGESFKSFMLHYNFPPFCVGEVKFLRAPGRREVGHGALAERAIEPILPANELFPYTIRIVSDVLESNGSSSMATVCGGVLSLMDAGVPISKPVAGIAMGLIKEGDEFFILSDILGDEDHLGDMDFKVAGTEDGITALQMDIKISGVNKEIMREALYQARQGRLFILEKMGQTIKEPRPELSIYAPRIVTIHVKPEKVKDVIGPGGKNIKHIIEQTGVKIDIEDGGKVSIASNNIDSTNTAIKMIRKFTQEVEQGQFYLGRVKKIMDFGAFVEIFPGTDGLIHISQISHERIKAVTDVLKEGDEVMVKVIEVDSQGRIKLSRKEALGHKLS